MTAITVYEKTTSFLWQHLLLILSMFVMTFGVALCVKSNIGCSVISTIPFVMTLAGDSGQAPPISIGEYTYIMNFLLVGLQIVILRRRFQPIQLFQLLIGFVFGFLLDINMAIVTMMPNDTIISELTLQLSGCIILAFGIAMEIRSGSVTMPGEGITVAISQASHIPFPKAKIIVDITMVLCAVALGYLFFGSWQWNVVGLGTLLAMFLVGGCIKVMDSHMNWFNKILYYKPGYQRHIYGLAKFVYRRFN